MDPLSAASAVAQLVSVLGVYKELLSILVDQPEGRLLEQQLTTAEAQLRLLSTAQSFLTQLPAFILGDIQKVTYQAREVTIRLQTIHRKYNDRSTVSRAVKRTFDKKKIAEIGENVSKTIHNVYREYKMYMILDMGKQINLLRFLTEATAKYFETGLSDLRNDLNSLVQLLAEKFDQPLEKFTDIRRDMGERQHDFEELREALRRSLGSGTMRPFAFDPFCFPFVIVSSEHRELVGGAEQVKLDTGAHDCWVGKHVLERHGIEFESTDDQRIFIGAGRREFRALGKVTLMWYSENQALTKKTNFLVGQELPFDVILGSDYLMDDLNTDAFKTPILPLRSILTKEELQELEKTQREKGAKAEDIRKIQKEKNLKNFEERRKAKRESRLTTPAYPGTSSSFLFPPSTPASISRRSSLASRSVTPGISRLSSQEPDSAPADTVPEDEQQGSDHDAAATPDPLSTAHSINE